ncbi:MAG: hypothetical protein ABIC96_03905 [Patescibacteria group bacterium]
MSKIILTNYPYQKYEIGDIVDLGEEKNASMVSLGRAVWAEEDNKSKKAVKKETPPPVQEKSQTKQSSPAKKKFLENKLRKQVQERKVELTKKEAESPSASEVPASEPEPKDPARHVSQGDTGREKQFLQNDLKKEVKERKDVEDKKSFWDNLK